ncbi:MAG: hypothetical protein JWM80_5793 [Cyanobacteria bacterium RYN_339]|nr:hypothetical protein [Cyanobacteria bacterium RYN_339]
MQFTDLVLTCADPEGLRAFYRERLGLAPAGDAVQAGLTRLAFQPGAAATYHFAFNIPENQLEEARQWLRARVPLVQHEGSEIVDFPNWNAHSVYFFDPAGNIVELIARHNLPNASRRVFGPEAFQEVSEVGLPVPAVAPVVDVLDAQWHQPLWWGNRETFAAVGDEQGLFIVVPEGRTWYMSGGMTAVVQPLEVVAALADGGRLAGVPAAYCLMAN